MPLTCFELAQSVPLDGPFPKGQEQAFRCPRHNDQHPSLLINLSKDAWFCGPCGKSGNAWQLVAFIAGCSPDDKKSVKSWLRNHGLQLTNGSRRNLAPGSPPSVWYGQPITNWYVYHDSSGHELYRVGRTAEKEFPVWCKQTWGLKDKSIDRVPYRLPELLKADDAFVVEGEKDADTLKALGLTASCNPGGAGKWLPAFAAYFRPNQRITVIPDNDAAGRKHAEQVARSLAGRVASLKILNLPGLPEKGDVSDWVAGRDPIEAAKDLRMLAEAAQEWEVDSPAHAKRFQIHWAAEALQPQPIIPWVVDSLLPAGSVNLVVGEPGSKKTWAALDLAVCCALGRPWLDYSVNRGPVLVVDEESGTRRLLRRIGDAMRGHNADVGLPLAFTSLAGFNLLIPEDVEHLRSLVKEVNPVLVLIDALADVMLGGDENLVRDIQPVFQRLRKIAEENQCAILVIHHSGKGGKYRGSSAMKGAVDLLLVTDSAPGSEIINFRADKSRDVIVPPFTAKALFEDRAFKLASAGTSSIKSQLKAAEEYVMRYLGAHPGATTHEITNAADTCSSQGARKAIYFLANKGLIYRKNPEVKGKGAQACWCQK